MTRPARSSDLIVIGGGVLGAFHALAATKRGLSVTLLERNNAPQGASVRNFGQVVPSGLDQHWQKYGRESLRIYRELQQQHDLSIRQLGSIYIASNEEEVGLIEELNAINAEADYPSELWTAQQCRQRYPQLRADYCRAGLFFPEEVSVNPRQMIHRLHDFLSQQSKYQSYFQACIRELEVKENRQVTATTTSGEVFTADKAILCCGHEFQLLYPDLFQSSDLEAVKLQMLRLKPQPEISLPGNVLTGLSIRRYESFSLCPSWNEVKAREADDSLSKRWGIHVLFKQEADGGIILGDSHEYASASHVDELGFDVCHEINAYIIELGRQIFDLPNWDVEASWCGFYSQTTDPSGIFTKTIEDNIHIVTGIGGKGMTSSAGYAEQSIGELYND